MQCLWCEREFEWDRGMYKFCDGCIVKIEEVEEIVFRVTREHINLAKELEER